MDPIDDGCETSSDHGWTKVVKRKQNLVKRKKNQLAMQKIRSRSLPEDEKPKPDKEKIPTVSLNLKAEEIKKTKPKKEETMPKVSLPEDEKPQPIYRFSLQEKMPQEASLAEALAKIDASDLATYLADSPNWYHGIWVFNLTDYFGKALSDVSSEQFKYPWPNMNKLTEVADIPFTHIPQDVYQIAAKWLDQAVPCITVRAFVLWSFDFTHARLEGRPTSPTKSQLAVFVVLSIILRSHPLALVGILPLLRKAPFQTEDAHDMFQLTVWMMAQISHNDLAAGLFAWSRNLLPLVVDKNKCKPESVDLVLQLIEKILASPNALNRIMRHAVEEVVRLIPMSSFEMLLRLTFPDPSDRVNDTKRFEKVYPDLKKIALADAPGDQETDLVTQPIFDFSFKFAGEGKNPDLDEEASDIAIWCMTKNARFFYLWSTGHDDNLEGSIAILKRLVEKWKEHSPGLISTRYSINLLKETMDDFQLMNKYGITEERARASLYKEADKYVTTIITALFRSQDKRK